VRARLQTHSTADRTRPVLVWRAPKPFLCISSAPFGGGLALRSWIVNAEVPKDYGRVDLGDHAGELKAELQLAGDGVMLLTAASVEKHTAADDDGVLVSATVGITIPTWAAAPDGLAGLVGAVATATEAKTQALIEAGVAGSGTASDAVCIACPADGPVETFGGVRSTWGARLARAVHGAVLAGC
jgi:adenosylcobinamide amidohydrolase